MLITAIHRDPNIPDMRDEWGVKDRQHITILTFLLADVVKQIEQLGSGRLALDTALVNITKVGVATVQ